MKIFLCLMLVGVVSCTSMLKILPPNAEVKYMSTAFPIPAVKNVVPIAAPATSVPAVKNVVPISAPAAPVPTVNKAGATKTYYKVDDGQLERVKPTHVGYSVLPEAPVVKSVPVHVAPAPAVKTGRPTASTIPYIILAFLKIKLWSPLIAIRGIWDKKCLELLRQQDQLPWKQNLINKCANSLGLVPGAPVPYSVHVPGVMVKSAPATPAPASPLIKTFWKQDDGELEKITPTHVSYSLVKSAPAPGPVVPVAAPAPVVYSLPTPAPTTVEQESLEDEED